MDKPQFYDNDWMLNRRGIESVFGFSYPLKDFGAEGEVKAWFLGYLHGLNEKKRYNPFGKIPGRKLKKVPMKEDSFMLLEVDIEIMKSGARRYWRWKNNGLL